MSESVVDDLESIEIEHKQRAAFVGRGLQLFGEAEAVWQLG